MAVRPDGRGIAVRAELDPRDVAEQHARAGAVGLDHDIAELLGRPPQLVNEIVRDKKAITPDTAVGLERVFGVSAKTWMNMQVDYELTLAYQRVKPDERAR